MAEQFPIISVPSDAPEDYEAMGTKQKFWFYYQELGLCLYKQARPNTGEDWSEKIAAELCELLGLPHAIYELATFNGTYGIISQSFVPQGATLTPGNEILFPIVPDYPKVKSYKVPQHTIDIVLEAIGNGAVNLPIGWTPPVGIKTAVDTFVGYLLLDAWIGNTDRHHENWAFLLHKGGFNQTMTHLAPTYDHASCLGRELQDEERYKRLNTKDAGFSVKRYAEKCTSALYASVGDKKPLKTFDAFREAAQRHPNAALVWLNSLARVSTTHTSELFFRIPCDRISRMTIQFAQKILELNQRRLLELRSKLP